MNTPAGRSRWVVQMEKTMTIDQLKIGQIHQSSVTITEDMIKRFAMELFTDQFSQSIDLLRIGV